MDELIRANFLRDIADLINRYSFENQSDTPDFILAEYLVRCLENFDLTCNWRRTWYSEDNTK